MGISIPQVDGRQSPEMLLPCNRELSDSTTGGDGYHVEKVTNGTSSTMVGFSGPAHNNSATCSSSEVPLSNSPLGYPVIYGHNVPSTGTTGIMPLTNFSFNNGARAPRPTLTRAPKITPMNFMFPGVPTYNTSERSIHHFGRMDGPKVPWLVPTLVVIHSIMFAITMYLNDCPHTSANPQRCVLRALNRLSFQPFRENPMLGPSYEALLAIGALQSTLVTNAGQGWRLFTSVWLHAGFVHLLANMICLLSLGFRLERDFGWVRVGTIYVMGGFGGSLLSALFMDKEISVGASGALMGLLGATVAELLINWATYQQRSKSLAALLLAIAVNLSIGLMPHVDNFAHIGGVIGGFMLGFVCLMRPRFAWVNQMVHDLNEANRNRLLKQHTRLQRAIWFVALALLVVSYSTAMLALFKGYGLETRRRCKWCHYMTCVPSSLWQCTTT